MFSTACPELLHSYYRAERPVPRQVVEPSTGVWGRAAHQPTQYGRRKVEGEGADFYSVFSKAMERNLG